MRLIVATGGLFSLALLVVGYVRLLRLPRLYAIEAKAMTVCARTARLEKKVLKWKVAKSEKRLRGRSR